MNNQIKLAKKCMEDADAILITAGAGMGVDSGLPDYRGDEGFYQSYPIFKNLNVSFSEITTPNLFDINPKLAWGFYGHRLELYRNTKPHKGFSLLQEYIEHKKINSFVLTSNVDGQFQKAGFNPNKIFEIHGSIHHTQCHNRCCSEVFDNEMYDYHVNTKTLEIDILPLCPYCNEILRPNILMFSDGQLRLERLLIQNNNYNEWLLQISACKLVILEIGAGPSIPAVREYGENIVKCRSNTTLIRINPKDNKCSDISISMSGLEALKLLCS